MGFLLALDQGTTSSRAILFDSNGEIVASDQQEFPQVYPQPGWVEHNPEAIWESQFGVAQTVLSKAGVGAPDVAAIGIANQRETTVVWERATGRPIHNAIVWQDRRTADNCEKLRSDGMEDLVRRKTGLVLDPYFSATKLRWILENVPGARQRADDGELAFGTIDSWVLYRLTGIHATDPSNASRTLLYNIHTQEWDGELAQLFGVPQATLPGVRPSSGYFGETTLLGGSIPVMGMAGDQQAATFGQACFRPGMVKNTYGTGSFLLMNTGREVKVSRNRLLSTVAWQVGGETDYALEGSIFVTGAAIQWLRDELGIIGTAADSEALAGSVPDSDGVYFVPAFTGMGAPHWDASARGALVGLTRGTGRSHIARAALEAACFQTREVIEAMQADCGVELTDLRVDGGMTANNLLLQVQSNLLGIPVHRPKITETTALGAAYLAGLAAGVWSGKDAIEQQWKVDRTFEPSMSADQRESMYDGWKRAVHAVRQF